MDRAWHVMAVSCREPDQIAIWTDTEEMPTVVTTTPSQRTTLYLQGVHLLLEFALSEGWQSVDVAIHMDNLQCYNVLSRYLWKWKQQFWHTARNQPVQNKELVQSIDKMLAQFSSVKFRNVSEGFEGDKYIKKCRESLGKKPSLLQ